VSAVTVQIAQISRSILGSTRLWRRAGIAAFILAFRAAGAASKKPLKSDIVSSDKIWDNKTKSREAPGGAAGRG
jgi:hypothetical protein